MTTEDLIEEYIQAGRKAFIKLYGNTKEGGKLSRKEKVIIQNHEFTCWREYTVFKMAEYIAEILPNAEIKVELDGNNTVLQINISNEEQQKLNNVLYCFLNKYNLV